VPVKRRKCNPASSEPRVLVRVPDEQLEGQALELLEGYDERVGAGR